MSGTVIRLVEVTRKYIVPIYGTEEDPIKVSRLMPEMSYDDSAPDILTDTVNRLIDAGFCDIVDTVVTRVHKDGDTPVRESTLAKPDTLPS